MKKIFAILTLLLILSPVLAEEKTPDIDSSISNVSNSSKPYPLFEHSDVRNVILCIGDGMGLGQVTLARLAAAGADGKLYMERMPILGLIKTHSADAIVTDSAASGTALAAGFKTNNGMVGRTPNGNICLSILEAAKKKQMATGLIATSEITHATPASFAAHVKSRDMQPEIAQHLLANKVNVILGGGREYFLPKSHPKSKRKDDLDLINQAVDSGYNYIETSQQLRSATGPYILGLFQDGPMKIKSPEPDLAELTKKAIEILNSAPHGFFLMIEGSQIDWACHDNNAKEAVKKTLLFDEAVKAAIDFALKDKHTLVIVTADHETGGLTIKKGGDLQGRNLNLKWTTRGHTGLPVPIYAFGPAAGTFTGVYDNTEVPKKIAKLLGIKSFPQLPQPEVKTKRPQPVPAF